MRLSEIQHKDIINISTGENIGNIIDVNVDHQSGKINSFILEKKKFSSLFSSNNESEILWEQINKIGEDVILVESFKS